MYLEDAEYFDHQQQLVELDRAPRVASSVYLGNDWLDKPCKHGHLDCSTREGGSCSDEQRAFAEAVRVARRRKNG